MPLGTVPIYSGTLQNRSSPLLTKGEARVSGFHNYRLRVGGFEGAVHTFGFQTY